MNKYKYDVGDVFYLLNDIEKLSTEFTIGQIKKLYHKKFVIEKIEQELWGNNIYYYFNTPSGRYCIPEKCILGKAEDVDKDRNIIWEDVTNFCQCSHCGKLFKLTNGGEKQEEYYLCEKCAKRYFVLPYHRYYPSVEFFKKGRKDEELYLGVELEIDKGGEFDSVAKQIMQKMNENNYFVYCSHDGSLNDGMEIITQPSTLKYHLSIMPKYEELFKFLIDSGYRAHNTSTCGIHIHFNRNFYADNENLYITRLLYLVEKFWDELVIFSRRNYNRLDYTKKLDRPIGRFIDTFNKADNHDGHYFAINITNENTIEFRIFKGTLNVKTYRAILEFVHSCIITAKTKSTEELQTMKFTDLLATPTTRRYYKDRLEMLNLQQRIGERD